MSFKDDVDGTDNWSIICNIDKEGTKTPELIATNYPAFDLVNKYGTANKLQGDYANDWYIPGIAELCELYRNKSTVTYNSFMIKRYIFIHSMLTYNQGESGCRAMRFGRKPALNSDYFLPRQIYQRYIKKALMLT